MKVKIAALFVTFLLFASSLLMLRTAYAQPTPGAPVYFSFQPVAMSPLTDINSSVNGLETPATPSPVGQYFNVEIHLIGATVDNVTAGIGGLEVHFDFGAILAYAQVINFTNMLGLTGGVLTGPPSGFLTAIPAGFYDNSDKPVSGPPYTNATRYEVASASTALTAWNAPDGLVAVILFKITGQPAQQDFYASMTSIFSGLTDGNSDSVPFDIVEGTLHIDASAAKQFYSLAVNIVGNGSVTQSPSAVTYSSGTVVALTAVPAVNWTFQSWSGAVSGSQNPINVTMTGNKVVTATFVQGVQLYNLTVNVVFVSIFNSVVKSGQVSVSPVSATYLSGSIVTLNAAAGANWTFWNWTGDVSGEQNPVNITMNSDKNVTATFGLIWDFNRDGDVSISDLRVLALAWRSYHISDQTSPNWNPRCDIAAPFGVIGLTDLVTLAIVYGKLH